MRHRPDLLSIYYDEEGSERVVIGEEIPSSPAF